MNNYYQRQANAYTDWCVQQREDYNREQEVSLAWETYISHIRQDVPTLTPTPIINEVYSIGSFFNKVYAN